MSREVLNARDPLLENPLDPECMERRAHASTLLLSLILKLIDNFTFKFYS